MIDIIVAIFIIASIYIGYKRGLIKVMGRLFSGLVSLVLAIIIYPITREMLKATSLYEVIREVVAKMLEGSSVAEGVQTQAEIIREMTSGLPEFINENIIANNNPAVYSMLGVNDFMEYVVEYISWLALGMVAFLITWAILQLVFMILFRAVNLITVLPIIKQVNQWTGLIAGGIKSIIILWILGIIVPLLAIIPRFRFILEMINESLLTYYLYNNNLILQYINQLLIR